MRTPLGLLAPALALGLLLAGCTGPSEPAPDDITTVPVIRDPGDFSSQNATTPGEHIHDYWGGRDVVQVLDQERDTSRIACQTCDSGILLARFVPADGDIVPQGTARVDVTVRIDTVQYEGSSPSPRFELWVQTAEDGEAWRVGEVKDSTTLAVEGTQQRNDPPHYVLSLWSFEVRLADSDAFFEGSAGMAVTAHRGLPLVPYPPHPDRWQGSDELVLLEATQAAQAFEYESPTGAVSTFCPAGCPGQHALPEGLVVPYDARTVEIRLTYDAGSVPAGLEVAYHGADTRQPKPIAPEGTTPGEMVFTLELAPGEADSPYAPRSLWVIDVALDDTGPARAWMGTYGLRVTASK